MSFKKQLPDVEYLRQVLDYNPDTGIFIWKHRPNLMPKNNNARVGKNAGSVNANGYLIIHIDGINYQAHRLAWAYIYNDIDIDQIDHINGAKSDNRICNLRKSTHGQNQQNRSKFKNNKSGFKGVSFFKPLKKWRADLRVGKKLIYLGYFNTPQEAHNAYCNAARLYHGDYAKVE